MGSKRTKDDDTPLVVTEEIQFFLDAQAQLGKAVDDFDAAFVNSAIRTYSVLISGASLRKLGALNKEENAQVVGRAAQYLYTSPEHLTVHALTGRLFLAEHEDGEEWQEFSPEDVQTVVNRVKRLKGVGVHPVREVVENADSIEDGLAKLAVIEVNWLADEKARKDAEQVSVTTDTTDAVDDLDTEEGPTVTPTVEHVDAQVVAEQHITAVVDLVTSGVMLSDASWDMLYQLLAVGIAAAGGSTPQVTEVA